MHTGLEQIERVHEYTHFWVNHPFKQSGFYFLVFYVFVVKVYQMMMFKFDFIFFDCMVLDIKGML